MAKTKNTKEKQEELLLAYIDIPYFRNNPTYIERWRTYYRRYREPQILLLMYHKQISTFYHWIYLELAQHFLRKSQPQIAHFVLNEALKNNVYDAARIKEAMEKIPPFEKRYSKGDMLGLLNVKNIQALGKTWNCFNETFFYQTSPPKDSVNYEIQKIKNYEKRHAQGGIEMKGIITNFKTGIEHPQFTQQETIDKADVTAKYEESCKSIEEMDKTKTQLMSVGGIASCGQNDSTISNVGIEQMATLHSQECVIHPGPYQGAVEKEPKATSQQMKILADDKHLSIAKTQPTEKEHTAELAEEAERDYAIGSSSYISVQENDKEYMQSCKKHREDSSGIFETVFFKVPDDFELNSEVCFDRYIYLVQKNELDGVVLLRIAKNADITQTMIGKTFFLRKCSYLSCKVFKNVFGFDACKSSSEYFILYEYGWMCDLKDIILTAGAYVKYFYLKKVLEKILLLMEKEYLLVNVMGFFVDQDFDLGFNCVELCELNDNSIEMTIKLLKESFLTPCDELTIDLHMISKLNDYLNAPAARKEILKHKTEVLQSI